MIGRFEYYQYLLAHNNSKPSESKRESKPKMFAIFFVFFEGKK